MQEKDWRTVFNALPVIHIDSLTDLSQQHMIKVPHGKGDGFRMLHIHPLSGGNTYTFKESASYPHTFKCNSCSIKHTTSFSSVKQCKDICKQFMNCV